MTSQNVLILTYWSFKDALIQAYTLPYVRMIRRRLPEEARVYLLTLEQSHNGLTPLELKRVSEELGSEGISLITFRYLRFGVKAAAKWIGVLAYLLGLMRRRHVGRIHAWCTPAGAAGFILSRLSGIPLVLDSYEPHAESMVEDQAWPRSSMAFRILFDLERRQSKRATHVIAASQGMRDYALQKYKVAIDKFYVKPACVDLKRFSPRLIKEPKLLQELGMGTEIVCVYAGKFGGIYLDQEIFDFFKVATEYWPGKFRVLLLTSEAAPRIMRMAKRSEIEPSLIISRFVEHKRVPEYLALGDFAINPVKPVPSKRLCTSIKDGEYWAMGLPVVIPSGISDDSGIIAEHGIGSVLQDLNKEAYLKSIKEIDALLNKYSRVELQEKVRAVAVRYRSLSIAESAYDEIYGKAERDRIGSAILPNVHHKSPG